MLSDDDRKVPLTPKVARASAAGKNIMIMTQGTRGDMQPIIALGQALKQAGFVVKVGTNVDQVAPLQKNGLDAVELAVNLTEFMDNPTYRELMATGNLMKVDKLMSDLYKTAEPNIFAQKMALMKDFQPDVMICETPKDEYDSRALADYYGVPVIMQFEFTSKQAPESFRWRTCWWSPQDPWDFHLEDASGKR